MVNCQIMQFILIRQITASTDTPKSNSGLGEHISRHFHHHCKGDPLPLLFTITPMLRIGNAPCFDGSEEEKVEVPKDATGNDDTSDDNNDNLPPSIPEKKSRTGPHQSTPKRKRNPSSGTPSILQTSQSLPGKSWFYVGKMNLFIIPFVAKMALVMNDVSGAIKACELALRTNRDSCEVLLFLGPLLLQQGYYQQAIEVYQHLLSLNHGTMSGRVADWLSCLAFLSLACGDSDKSFSFFQQALKYESYKQVSRNPAQSLSPCLGCSVVVQNRIVL